MHDTTCALCWQQITDLVATVISRLSIQHFRHFQQSSQLDHLTGQVCVNILGQNLYFEMLYKLPIAIYSTIARLKETRVDRPFNHRKFQDRAPLADCNSEHL
jgi:hypothetical protein